MELVCPGQILPRANLATYLDRVRRWSCFSAQGASEAFGGRALQEATGAIPLRSHIFVSDALPTNDNVNAMEEQGLPPGVARLGVQCTHHQSCLAKRTATLMIGGLCTGLIRMCGLTTTAVICNL